MKVYLAGGFRSNWQEHVKSAVPMVRYFDPREHNLQDKAQYTLWDLEAIRHCDVVFAYFEKTNEGGYALALELGFAKALGKRIVLVDEKSQFSDTTRRYLGMLHAVAEVVLEDIDEGITFLQSLSWLSETTSTEASI